MQTILTEVVSVSKKEGGRSSAVWFRAVGTFFKKNYGEAQCLDIGTTTRFGTLEHVLHIWDKIWN